MLSQERLPLREPQQRSRLQARGPCLDLPRHEVPRSGGCVGGTGRHSVVGPERDADEGGEVAGVQLTDDDSGGGGGCGQPLWLRGGGGGGGSGGSLGRGLLRCEGSRFEGHGLRQGGVRAVATDPWNSGIASFKTELLAQLSAQALENPKHARPCT